LDFVATNLPTEIDSRCIDIVSSFGLTFGALDLIETPAGEFVFLELNPNGQWAWIEMGNSQPISDAIIDLLSGRN
jgi:glutathione synthase/RimK-type ligase-like ATP-grasp enzyme